MYSDGRSSQNNVFEADAVASLAWLLHGRTADQPDNERDPRTGAIRPQSNTPYVMHEFWARAVGVVAPHRAQQGMIVGRLQQAFAPLGGEPADVRNAVDTVERFQGQERDVMIASLALGDPDQIGQEDEFLQSLNRFNVMVSRARAKLIVFVSQEVVDHRSPDLETLRDSRLLKVFPERFCSARQAAVLGVGSGPTARRVPVDVRWQV